MQFLFSFEAQYEDETPCGTAFVSCAAYDCRAWIARGTYDELYIERIDKLGIIGKGTPQRREVWIAVPKTDPLYPQAFEVVSQKLWNAVWDQWHTEHVARQSDQRAPAWKTPRDLPFEGNFA